MSQLLTFWWLLTSETDTADHNTTLATATASNPPPAATLPPVSLSYWWSRTEPAPEAAPEQEPAPDAEAAPPALWWLFWGSLTPAAEPKSPEQPNPDEPATPAPWFPWFSQPQTADELDTDAEDALVAAILKEARAALEGARDSCHYAVKSSAAAKSSPDAELAVAGTASATQPARFNRHKRPVMPCEVFENTLRKRPPPAPQPAREAPAENGALLEMLAASLPPPANSSCAVVVPSLNSNLRHITVRTKLRLVGEAFIHGPNTSEKHLYRKNKKRRRARHVTVIAMHSFLPAKLVKSAIGQSTANATALVRRAHDAVSDLAAAEGWSPPPTVTSIALDGQGPIAERAAESHHLLQNWRDEILASDLVYVVASQAAVPAALLMLDSMLHESALHGFGNLRKKKIAFLSLAGILCGPYVGLDSRVVLRAYTVTENEVIAEVIDLQKRKLALGGQIDRCIARLCDMNVKFTFAGALTDQFVPLYSAVGNHLRHPNLFRVAWIEDAAVAADSGAGASGAVPHFMLLLISLILTMLNLGHSDQNLIRDLGERLRGYGGADAPHGKLLDDTRLFLVALRFATETTTLVHRYSTRANLGLLAPADPTGNLYHLPWNVRGLINDLMLVKNINNLGILSELVEEFQRWDPDTRAWRDLKFCFAGFEEMSVDEMVL